MFYRSVTCSQFCSAQNRQAGRFCSGRRVAAALQKEGAAAAARQVAARQRAARSSHRQNAWPPFTSLAGNGVESAYRT